MFENPNVRGQFYEKLGVCRDVRPVFDMKVKWNRTCMDVASETLPPPRDTLAVGVG